MLKHQAALTALLRPRTASSPGPTTPSVPPASQTPSPPPPPESPSPPSPPFPSRRLAPRPALPMSSNLQVSNRPEPPKPPPQAPSAYFPLGYKDAVYQWWTSVTPPLAERSVLSLMPYVKEAVDGLAASAASPATRKPDPFGTRTWRQSLVQLSGRNRALNEICIQRHGEDVEETLVMLHGYGAGLGFFYKNFEPITRLPGLRLYALDMLGMGNSSRPPFKIHARDKQDKVTEAEDWFVDALEEWRKARKIERFTLLGHSLGGYLAVSYALKYPGHLNKLLLASPVGIPENPYAVNASLPEPPESTFENEVLQDQATATATASRRAHASASNPNHVAAQGQPNAPQRPLPSWLVWLWDANVSPFSIVRMAGPLGPRFVSGWSSRRFSHLPADEAKALHDYSFSIFKQKGSGEYALAYILAPGAYARRPVINRIHQVGRQPIRQPDGAEAAVRETGIPVVFMYGENDWMDVAGGLAAEQKLNEARAKALLHGTPQEQRDEKGSVRVLVVPGAGHHLYLDNPDHFNEIVRKELEETMAEGRQQRLTT